MARIVIYLLRIYQKMSLWPGRCRYSPTCSEYSIQAISKYGLLSGMFLSLKRLIRCNQFFSGGFDQVR